MIIHEGINIRQYLELKEISYRQIGRELVTKCPFNGCDEDTKPSELPHLYINPETTEYFCHKCEAKGNLITFARLVRFDL